MLSNRTYLNRTYLNRSGWGLPNPILKPWPPRIQGQGPDSVIPRRPQTSGPNSSWADAGRQVQRNERPKGYEVKVCQDENLTIQPEMVYWFIAFQDFLANFLSIWMSLSISNECHHFSLSTLDLTHPPKRSEGHRVPWLPSAPGASADDLPAA